MPLNSLAPVLLTMGMDSRIFDDKRLVGHPKCELKQINLSFSDQGLCAACILKSQQMNTRLYVVFMEKYLMLLSTRRARSIRTSSQS